MTPVRVLVVDDSVVIRRLVTTVLEEHDDVTVIATAANGQIAIDKLSADLPDVVCLDIEMPVMNGIETLREIRKRWPRLPVIMFSTLSVAGASATLDALSAGASDFVAKPSNVGSVSLGMQAVRDELIPKIRALAGRRPVGPRSTSAATPTASIAGQVRSAVPSRPGAEPTAPIPPRTGPPARVSAVAVGVSTGGPNALAAIWPALSQLPVPVLIVQHMPPVFTTMLAKRLDGLGTVPVSEGADGDAVIAGSAWLAPGDHHMTVEKSLDGVRVRVDQRPPVNSCRPAVDLLFESAARVYGAGTLAVVLTGMGSDGLAGCRAIRAAGGAVVAQDEASSVVWGMPGVVANAGLADAIVPLDRMAAEISERARGTRRTSAGGTPLKVGAS